MTTQYELRSSGGGYDHLLSDDLSEADDVSVAVSQQHAGNTLGEQHIRFERVAKRYATKKGTVTALDNISLTIGRGEIFGVIGRSGAGKSTLIRTINRLESIDDGSVTINDVNVRQLRGNGLVALRRRIGMIFQHFNLLHSRTVYQNLALPARAAGLDNTEIKRRAERLLSLVGLAGKEAVYPSRLSGGQKQRVGIARALMLDPDILLCDEATSALDPETTATILALLRDINRQLGLTIVLITHEMAVIRDICDRVAVLDQGQLIESGSVGQIFSAPRHQLTRSLLAPLAVQLPVELAERVVDHADPEHTTTLVRLDVGGEHDGLGGLDLARLSALLGAETTLLHGGIERLQGRVYGRFFLGVAALDPTRMKQQWDQPGITAEVVGYV